MCCFHLLNTTDVAILNMDLLTLSVCLKIKTSLIFCNSSKKILAFGSLQPIYLVSHKKQGKKSQKLANQALFLMEKLVLKD